MRKLLFKLFGETKLFGWMFFIAILFSAIITIGVLWIAIHFILKLW